jgi:amino acid adenylation domain-containing protein
MESCERPCGDDHAGRFCHAAVFRLPSHITVEQVRANLAGLGRLRTRIWVQAVPARAGEEPAGTYRDREMRRPLASEPQSTVRLVLLTYTDGVKDLVVVAHRAFLDRRSLDLVAEALLSGKQLVEPETAAPRLRGIPRTGIDEWVEQLRSARSDPGTGPGAFRTVSSPVHLHRVALPGMAASSGLQADLLAALGLVVARLTANPRVVLGTVNAVVPSDTRTVGCAEGLAVMPLEVDEHETVGAYRTRVEAQWSASRYLWHTAELDRMLGPEGLSVPMGLVVAVSGGPVRYLPSQDLLYPLTVQVESGACGALSALCWHRPHELPDWWVAQFAGQFATVCRELIARRQDQPLTTLEFIDEPERRRIIDLGRTPSVAGSLPGLVHSAVEAQAARRPDAPAVTHEGETITYRELDQWANRLAQGLRRHGVGTGDRVGVCLDHSIELVAVLLAVLKTGAAYVPLDPGYPAARLAFVAEDAQLALVVVDDGTRARLGQTMVTVAELSTRASDGPSDPPASEVRPDDPAYVIYTSGSTGRPKGVVIPHRNVLSLLAGTRSDFGFGDQDTWTWFHSVAFDFSVWEIWGCLLTGGRLVVVPHWVCRSPEDFRDLLMAERVTVLNQTPSAFAQLLDLEGRRPTNLDVRLVIFGGELLDTRMLLPWFDVHPESGCRLVNMFGITETTVHVTAQTVTRAEALIRSKSVGRAIPGWSVRVVDRMGRLLPPGACGEIAVGGDGLALHYLNRAELTRQRFVADPVSGERLYLSGDRGRLLPDGRLEHLGRLDNQVKVRGYRIELDEIRTVLVEDPAVAAAAVVLHEDEGGDAASSRLDAYVVLSSQGPISPVSDIRKRVGKVLPDYMMPGTVTAVPSLPLTANGKLDVAQLPAPSHEHRSVPIPADDVETAVLAAWRSVLGREVGSEDNFFDLGGNSLLAVRTVAALRDIGFTHLPIRELYRHPTAHKLAAYLQSSAPGHRATAQEAVS